MQKEEIKKYILNNHITDKKFLKILKPTSLINSRFIKTPLEIPSVPETGFDTIGQTGVPPIVEEYVGGGNEKRSLGSSMGCFSFVRIIAGDLLSL